MNIKELNPNEKEFTENFLKEYCQAGFGRMNKKDFEILVIHLLETHSKFAIKSNFEASVFLGIPEIRVAALRYESILRFPPKEKHYFEAKLLVFLAKADLEIVHEGKLDKVRFAVEDKFIRQTLACRLKQQRGFSDTSFNPEIVEVSRAQFFLLIKNIYGEKYAAKLEAELTKVQNSEDRKEVKSIWCGILGDLLKSIATESPKWITQALPTILQQFKT